MSRSMKPVETVWLLLVDQIGLAQQMKLVTVHFCNLGV